MEKLDGSKPDAGRQMRLIRLQEVKYRTGRSMPTICRRMRAGMGEFLETVISGLPMHLDRTLAGACLTSGRDGPIALLSWLPSCWQSALMTLPSGPSAAASIARLRLEGTQTMSNIER